MQSRATSVIADEILRPILEKDRVWSAYALADLSPPWQKHADWSIVGESLLLVYQGLSPPVMFGVGEPDELSTLFKRLASGSYWYTLRPTDFALVRDRVHSFSRSRMWRMILTDETLATRSDTAIRLHKTDQMHVDQLFAVHPDRPDAFHPDQVEYGVYFGVFEDRYLVSVAGTHVLDRKLGVAAVGNVFTDPEYRRRGYGRTATSAVISHLVELGIETIVLNVEMANQSAIDMYRKLGFMPYCGFYEGTAELI